HDALRLRFVRDNSAWQQYNADIDSLIPFTQIDLSALSETDQRQAIENKATALQTALNLSEGPIVAVALFNVGQQKPGYLLIVIHHLAVDGVSWRILLEDLQTAYEQLSRGEAMQLPAKTTSFKEWSQQLQTYAQSATLKAELTHWSMQPESQAYNLPVDYSGGANTEASACTVAVTFSAEETTCLLQQIPATYGTQINDVLLTALMQAFVQWTGHHALFIHLEGHGREDIMENVDVSRTVGWFTSIFPALLKIDPAGSPRDILKAVKEQLRQIPNRGVGYGLLRYLSEDTAIREKLQSLPTAQVSFNYLGQYDQLLTEHAFFRMEADPIPVGPMVSPHGTRFTLLYIGGNIVSGQLHVDFQYSQNIHKSSTIESVASAFAQALRVLISDCQTPNTSDYTTADFPNAKLSQQDFATVMAKLRQRGE
ncbi:MAG: condensation domain-containing protein, partial [Ktedonobacteraceae bacterium]